jgi:hypothetical protein
MLLEFAVCTPIFLLLCLGGFDLNALMLARQNVNFLAGSSASCIATGCDPAAVAYGNASGLGMDTSRLTVTVDGKTVTVVYATVPVSPFLPSYNMTATVVAP